MENYEKVFQGKTIMITGALGFIGSNLARRLVQLQPKRVILVDALIPGLGANEFNISDIKDKVEVYGGEEYDLRNIARMKSLVRGVDYVFNLAGSVSHIGSLREPAYDLDLNLRAHVNFLEACRDHLQKDGKRKLKILFSGTRDQYGKVKEDHLPVNENYLVEHAADPQGINNHAAEFYHLWYRGLKLGIESTSLRLTNIYGPRHQMKDPGQGVLNWFIKQAIDGETLQLWGGGTPLRDFVYVDDVVEAMLMVMASDKTDGRVYNIGSYIKKNGLYESVGGNISSIFDVANLITNLAGSGICQTIEYPEDRKPLEPGHFYADATKIYREVGWYPKVSLAEGIKRTIDFYRRNKQQYW